MLFSVNENAVTKNATERERHSRHSFNVQQSDALTWLLSNTIISKRVNHFFKPCTHSYISSIANLRMAYSLLFLCDVSSKLTLDMPGIYMTACNVYWNRVLGHHRHPVSSQRTWTCKPWRVITAVLHQVFCPLCSCHTRLLKLLYSSPHLHQNICYVRHTQNAAHAPAVLKRSPTGFWFALRI